MSPTDGFFYNDSIIVSNSWSLETWCNIVCYCRVFDGIKEVSFDGVHYLQCFHLQTAYHFRGFLEVTNWEAIYTLKQMLCKLVSRRIFILHDNLIIVLQTKRLEYVSSAVCYRWYASCIFARITWDTRFSETEWRYKMFPQASSCFSLSKINFPFFFFFIFQII